MKRLMMLPMVGLVHVLDGVLADLDRYLVTQLHQELRGPRRGTVRTPTRPRPE